MSNQSVVGGFSLRDLLTRVIPGLVVIGPFVLGANIALSEIIPTFTGYVILIGLVSYLIGEIIEQYRAGVFRVPLPFRYFIFKETGDIDIMPLRYRKAVKVQKNLPGWLNIYEHTKEESRLTNQFDFDFRKSMESKYGLDFKKNRPREIYDALLIDLGPDLTMRTQRSHSLAMFNTNLKIAVFLAGFIYIGVFIFGDLTPLMAFSILSFVLIGVLVIILTLFLDSSQHLYIELLLKEYYMKYGEEPY